MKLGFCFKLAAGISHGMDGHDVAVRDQCERQIAFTEDNPSGAVLGGAVELMNADRCTLTHSLGPTGPAEIQPLCPIRVRWAPRGYPDAGSILCVRRLPRTGVAAADYDLSLRMAERFSLADFPNAALRYRLHDGQIKSKKTCR